ncbi:GNAT family N-acetyltransferase [Actinotalea sp. M2MS4P-6]|uniref:GNAT family N-acetyltransferase n=1 Tax=Actinotalea sp. M2MS4P-6 TaxID=2983762 RepID=UPI0021E471F3|nr:GNAT family N-acetyltransferase [Actinotalea sp. M2MS4P-6]MCV2396482.1 GNAT family N-acetyltransferase [Actinotalea sp. M2MS4P-6]
MSRVHRAGTDVSGPIADRADAPAVLELPSPHLGLTWRPLTMDDVPQLHRLIGALEVADGVPRRSSEAEVAMWLRMPGHALPTDSLAGVDHTGQLRAYGLVEVRPGDETCLRAFLDGGVHPEWRGGGFGRALVAWMEGRGRQMLAASGRTGPARLAAYVDESARARRQLYAAAGFSPIRWYTDMRRDLAQPLPEAPLPEGARVETWSAELDDLVRLAHNEAFRDHWGSQPHSAETWQTWWQGPHSVHEWSLVALDDAGTVVGYLMSERVGAELQGFDSGVTALLGVLRPWRQRGLASALLVEAMRRYREGGMPYATLDVDADNPSGALGFYQRLGYERTHGSVLYSVEI